jgi:hypothetical protein
MRPSLFLNDLTSSRKLKLVAITGNNASNNPTLYRQLHKLLSKDFTSNITLADYLYDGRGLDQMQFKGDQSFVRCPAHILNLIAKAILKALNAGSHKDAKKLIYEMAKNRIESFTDTPRSAIARLRLIVLWLLLSEQRMSKLREYSDVGLDYDVDTGWNVLLKMLELAIRSKDAINLVCEEFRALDPLKLSPTEWNFLGEIYPPWQARQKSTNHGSNQALIRTNKYLITYLLFI